MTKDEVIEAIQAQKAEYGQAKSTYDNHLRKQAIKFFGTWQEACEAAGVRPVQVRKITREVRKDCRFIADDLSECNALNALYCLREDCVFFKPKRGKKHE